MICFDAYEIIQDEMVDTCLVDVIQKAGGHVIWLIACQHDLTNERTGSPFRLFQEGQFKAEPYNKIYLPPFTEDEIRTYFYECNPDRPLEIHEIAQIRMATSGIPLVVQMTAEAWANGENLQRIIQGEVRHEHVTKIIANRILAGIADSHHRNTIYFVAMMRQPDMEVLQAVIEKKYREESEATVIPAEDCYYDSSVDREFLKILRNILEQYFSKGDIKDLAFELGVDYENLPGSGKNNKARELLLKLKNEKRIATLVSEIKKRRPHVIINLPQDRNPSLTPSSTPPAAGLYSPPDIWKIIGKLSKRYTFISPAGKIDDDPVLRFLQEFLLSEKYNREKDTLLAAKMNS